MHDLRRVLSVSGVAVVLIVLFGLLGMAMTPGWKVEPNTSHVTVASPRTAIAARGQHTDAEGTYAVKTSVIRIRLSDTVTIKALLREPVAAQGRRPACLLIEGAGTGSSTQVFGDIAQAMASAGIVTLVPDKRLDNYTALHRDYQAMANDYMRSLTTLRERNDVDPAHTGIYAESEGTWIASVMAHDHPDIGFMILTSPPVVSGRHQMAMAATSYLRYIGAPAAMGRDISKIIGMDFSSLGLQYADFPAERYLSSFTMPMLVNFGTEDISMPVEQGANMLRTAAHSAGNDNVILRYYPANHQIRLGSHTAKPGLPLDPDYTHNLEQWINAIASGTTANEWATPMIAGTQPNQTLAAPRHTTPGLVHSLTGLMALIVLVTLFTLLAIVGGIALGIRALVGHRDSVQEPGARHDRGNDMTPDRTGPRFDPPLGAALLANILGTAVCMGTLGWYLVMIGKAALTLDTTQEAVFCRLWIVLHVMSVIAIVLLAWLMVALTGHVTGTGIPSANGRRRGYAKPVHGFGHVLVVGFVAAAATLSLSLLAFWGLFSC